MLKGVDKIYLILGVAIIVFSCSTRRANHAIPRTNSIDTVISVLKPIDTSVSSKLENNEIRVAPAPVKSIGEVYEAAYHVLEDMLEDRTALDFKKAVFTTENAYLHEILDYAIYEAKIGEIVELTKSWMKANPIRNYREKDSVNFHKNMAIFHVMKDTIYFVNDKANNIQLVAHYPYQYDFDDFFGRKDWTKMFVTKLLLSMGGNCHSLPYLYKILSNELGATAYISMAPSHFYIKNRSREFGWYNTELTSGDFPTDAWITASGYISLEAIRSGIFMDTLSQKQSIALCVFDLAKGYEKLMHNNDGTFVIKCCDLVLKNHPNNISAMILKAEIIKQQIERQMREQKVTNPKQLFSDSKLKEKYLTMQELYVRVLEMGYREMPERMYIEWLTSVELQKNKYSNQKISNTFKAK